MRARLLPAGALILGLTAVTIWWLRAPGPSKRGEDPRQHAPSGVEATFVGVATCADCHRPQTDRWRGSYHDRAMQPADASTVRGDFGGAAFRYAGVTSRFTARDGRYFVTTDGPDGALREYEIAYTFGDYPLQQYLVRFPGGRLQALSLSWDARPEAEGGQRWFHLYPREQVRAGDVLHWTGPAHNWNAQCAECHSTNLRKGYVADEDRYETTWSELDVSCEACHGPGAAHVAWARAGASGPAAGSVSKGLTFTLDGRSTGRWIMNPVTGIAERDRRLPSRSELETCARCHARRGLLTDAYVHGRPLADTHQPSVLDEGLYFADGQILDEVYEYGSFLQSRMHMAGVTCSDCHDPHDLRVGETPDEVCSRCHQTATFRRPAHHRHRAGSPGASCVNCHMPARTYMVVDTRRDHSFRVPRPDLSAALGTPNACTACHEDRPPEWAAGQALAWWGATRREGAHHATALSKGRTLSADAERSLRAAALDAAMPAIARATAVTLLARLLSPESADAVAAAAADPDPLVRAAAARTAERLPDATRALALSPLFGDPVRLVRVTAGRAAASIDQGALRPHGVSARDRALTEWIEVQREQSDAPGARVNLGALYVEQGQLAAGRAEYEAALRLQPAFVPALVNLADLHRMAGREEEAERVLREGLTRVPDEPALHESLGLLLVRTGRRAEALPAFERARALSPDEPRYAYVLGVAYHSMGRRDAALALLARSHDAHPGDRNTLEALVAYSREAGDRSAALEYARRLAALSPFDPGVRRLITELESSN